MKNKLDLDGYIALGRELKRIRRDIMGLMPYTNKLPKMVRKDLSKVRHYLERFRSRVEEEMFSHYQNDPRCTIYIFYGSDPKKIDKDS